MEGKLFQAPFRRFKFNKEISTSDRMNSMFHRRDGVAEEERVQPPLPFLPRFYNV